VPVFFMALEQFIHTPLATVLNCSVMQIEAAFIPEGSKLKKASANILS